MKSILDKFFFRSNNLDDVKQSIRNLSSDTPVKKIFEAINFFSTESEIRYVGGCIRKIIKNEKVDDIDLATNLEPELVCEALKKNNIKFYKSGIEHGTITALIDNYKFEITTLREDVSTDGRHAKVKFSKDWKKDASRRDFTFNSIYSDINGNLFDPYGGKKDLENGLVNFIGDVDERIKEDYLRILRYIRFFLIYSSNQHDQEIISKLKMNIQGVLKLSKERLLDELKKISKIQILEKLAKDKTCKDLIQSLFPELKNIIIFSKLNSDKRKIFENSDFIFILSLLIIDETDNLDYFLFKFNVSNHDKKRMKIMDDFFKEKSNPKLFSELNMNKVFYYDGKQAAIDILNYKIIKSNKSETSLNELINFYKTKSKPKLPISADLLMTKYNIPEGRELGKKLKLIEKEWVKNNFEISGKQINSILKT